MKDKQVQLRQQLYYQMALVRFFEQRILELFTKGNLSGTTHCYIGQEANAVGVINHLKSDDIIVSNHRCHGHYLVRTGDVDGLIAELMGKPNGICAGRGGSQHLCNGNFYTNGVLGSTVPIAAGMAFAEMRKDSGAITVLFMGDGAFGEGIVYETLNMISLWEIPILIVVENNFYAQSTPLALNCAGSLLGRIKAFGIQTDEIESNDAEELYNLFGKIIPKVRDTKQPYVQIINTYRLCPHSKGDDFRPADEIASWASKDPLKILGERISQKVRQSLEKQAKERINQGELAANK